MVRRFRALPFVGLIVGALIAGVVGASVGESTSPDAASTATQPSLYNVVIDHSST